LVEAAAAVLGGDVGADESESAHVGDEVGGAVGALGEVVTSRAEGFAPGDLVSSMFGWREAFVAPAAALEKLPRQAGVPDQAFLGVLGMPGLTGYAGLREIGQPKPGETVFVSGGAGAVGSVVAQVAKAMGCTVVATAGSDAKCDWLRSRGIDHAINYRTCGSLLEAVRAAVPKGIDVYFDNVGGEHLDAALAVANERARFAICGMIDVYNSGAATQLRYAARIIGARIRIQGFIVSDYMARASEFYADMGGMLQAGKLTREETVHDGLASMPDAFLGLFSGGNKGKMLVRV
jgi:NADPH-dependent curcumin reductase CurA